jgi:hypothetical protein
MQNKERNQPIVLSQGKWIFISNIIRGAMDKSIRVHDGNISHTHDKSCFEMGKFESSSSTPLVDHGGHRQKIVGVLVPHGVARDSHEEGKKTKVGLQQILINQLIVDVRTVLHHLLADPLAQLTHFFPEIWVHLELWL